MPDKSFKVDLKPTSLTFTGHSDTKKTTYHVELEFFGEIDVENSKTHHTSRDVEFVLRKKELKEEYWPRLLKETKKVHFLKTNFDKVSVFQSERRETRANRSSSGLMKTSKTLRLRKMREEWEVWVACLVWKAWVAWVETEALAASVCLRAHLDCAQLTNPNRFLEARRWRRWNARYGRYGRHGR